MPEPDTTPAARGCTRDDLLRNLRGYTPCGVGIDNDPAAQMLDDYAVEVARAERAATYRAAAGWLRAWADEGLLNAPEYGSHENVLDAADRLRARADQMEQQ